MSYDYVMRLSATKTVFCFFKNEQIFHVTNTYTILFLSSKIVFLILFDEFRQLRIQFTTNHYIPSARGITKILADKMILNFHVILCSIFLVIFFRHRLSKVSTLVVGWWWKNRLLCVKSRTPKEVPSCSHQVQCNSNTTL